MVGALVGCGDNPTEPTVPALCEEGATVAITVGPGVTPRFEWSPACRVTFLEVQTTETNPSAWTVFAGPFGPPGAIGIVPPVTYGTVPPGAIDFADAESLETGTTYVLVLSVIDILAGEYEVGRREFTP